MVDWEIFISPKRMYMNKQRLRDKNRWRDNKVYLATARRFCISKYVSIHKIKQ